MALEDLIYKRLAEDEKLAALLAVYDGGPAVFYQAAPDDSAAEWDSKKQYPRIDYAVDFQHNPERKTSGVLTLNIWSAKDGTPPEEIEPVVRELLCGIFLNPDDAPPYSLAWARSDLFDVERGDYILVGITVTFDVYAFPLQITSDPDPVLALNAFVRDLEPQATIIGEGEIAEIYKPTAEAPAFYFRMETIQTQRETNTVAWMDATLAGHIFAAGAETVWIKALVDALAIRGEVIMLDNSPMFLRSLKADNTLDALATGQVRIYARFGILRRSEYVHTLYNADRQYNT